MFGCSFKHDILIALVQKPDDVSNPYANQPGDASIIHNVSTTTGDFMEIAQCPRIYIHYVAIIEGYTFRVCIIRESLHFEI